MKNSLKSVFALGFIKTLVLIYDIITLPIYALLQKPWRTYARFNRTRAVRENEDDPYSPYVRVTESPFELVPRSMLNAETIGEVFKHACILNASKRCYGYREVFAEEEELQPNGKKFRKLVLNDTYTWVNYEDVDKDMDLFVKGLLANDINSGDKVVIFSETRPEWMLSANACFRMGAVVVTLYATLGDDAVMHGINESEATVVITSADLVSKLVRLADKIPNVKKLVYMENANGKKLALTEEDTSKYTIVSFHDIYREGRRMKDEEMQQRIVNPKQDDVAILMYTSGSTGNPKAVMITHRNFLSGFQSLLGVVLRDYPIEEDEVFIGFLPQAHILELMLESLMLLLGIPVGYSSAQTMLDSSTAIQRGCKGDISILKPTMMPAVPLILDRIRKGVSDNVRKGGELSEHIFDFAINYKRFWTRKGFRTPIADRLVFSSCAKAVGGKLKLLMVGGAPLSPDTQDFVGNVLNVRLRQGYASTETTASACVMDMDDVSLGRVGAPLQGVKLRLVDWPEGNYHACDKPHPRGEIVLGGNAISLGYYKNEEETKKCYFNEDGVRWWSSGDIGEVFEDGTVKIIDRKKDLVKLQFGEYISLGKVESELKNCQYVENICVHGDSMHNNLVALIVPNRASMKQLAKSLNKETLSFAELCQDQQIVAEVRKALIAHGTRCLLKMEIPTEIKLCREDWIPDSGLVTAALKIRRKQIEDFYKADILKMYSRNGTTKST